MQAGVGRKIRLQNFPTQQVNEGEPREKAKEKRHRKSRGEEPAAKEIRQDKLTGKERNWSTCRKEKLSPMRPEEEGPGEREILI